MPFQPGQLRRHRWTTIPLVVCSLLLCAAGNLVAAAVQASRGEISLPTYPWAAVKHPYFRGTDKVNIYPYPMLDFLSREKTNRTDHTAVLEAWRKVADEPASKDPKQEDARKKAREAVEQRSN